VLLVTVMIVLVVVVSVVVVPFGGVVVPLVELVMIGQSHGMQLISRPMGFVIFLY